MEYEIGEGLNARYPVKLALTTNIGQSVKQLVPVHSWLGFACRSLCVGEFDYSLLRYIQTQPFSLINGLENLPRVLLLLSMN